MVTSYYIMKMNRKTISMEEYYSGLHSMPLPTFSKSLQLKTKCRVCLQDGDNMLITSGTNFDEITEALHIFGNIEIISDDDNPLYLCYFCNKFLKSAILFREIANRTNEILKQLLLKQSPEPLGDYGYLGTFKNDESDLINMTEHFEYQKKSEDNGNKVYCPIREKILDKSSYKINLQLHDLNSNEESLKVQCPKCDKLLSKLSYKAHLRLHDSDRIQVLEQIVLKPLPDHLRDHTYLGMYQQIFEDSELNQINTEKSEDTTEAECPVCKKIICRTSYAIHLQQHKPNLPDRQKQPNKHVQSTIKTKYEWRRCHICKKVLKQNSYKAHLDTHNPDLPSQYVCEICGKSFKIKTVYQNHRHRHGTEHVYKCKLCPYTGRYKDSLRRHMLVHGELNYLCTQCPARYVSCGTLNIHMRKKHTEPQYKCDSCDKAFHNKLNLQRHIDAVHLGIKNHECNICGSVFSYRRYLLNHQRHMHKKANLKPIFSKSTYRPITITNDS